MLIILLILFLTFVHIEQGLKPIEEIRVGDKVLSLNERTGETSYQPVMELMQHQGTYQLIKVTLENGEHYLVPTLLRGNAYRDALRHNSRVVMHHRTPKGA